MGPCVDVSGSTISSPCVMKIVPSRASRDATCRTEGIDARQPSSSSTRARATSDGQIDDVGARRLSRSSMHRSMSVSGRVMATPQPRHGRAVYIASLPGRHLADDPEAFVIAKSGKPQVNGSDNQTLYPRTRSKASCARPLPPHSAGRSFFTSASDGCTVDPSIYRYDVITPFPSFNAVTPTNAPIVDWLSCARYVIGPNGV